MQISKGILRLLTLTVLSGITASCAYIIPENPNVPRNNTVMGEKRKPQLNVQVIGPQTALNPRSGSTAIDRVSAVDLPPVDDATAARAEKEMASATQVPAMAPVVVAQAPRYIPIENQEFDVAVSDYPSLNSVPPRPQMSGPGSADARLSATKAELEVDRTRALDAKSTLARDAAAEPSMLSEMPAAQGVAPVGNPVLAPMPSPGNSIQVPPLNQVRGKPQAYNAPSQQVSSISVSPPRIIIPEMTPVPAMAGNPSFVPPAPMNVASMPAEQPIVLASLQAPRDPILLRAPVAEPAPAPAIIPGDFDPLTIAEPIALVPPAATAPAPLAAAAPRAAAPGDFDPLTVADAKTSAPTITNNMQVAPLTLHPSSSYIAPSRYAAARR